MTEEKTPKKKNAPHDFRLLAILCCVLILVIASGYVRQKMIYHGLLIKHREQRTILAELQEVDRTLTSQANVLRSSKRVVTLGKTRYQLTHVEEHDVIYLKIEPGLFAHVHAPEKVKARESFIARLIPGFIRQFGQGIAYEHPLTHTARTQRHPN